MGLCIRDLSKKCEGKYKDCTDCVLDKVRAEIMKTKNKKNIGFWECIDIIDKYRTESEETDADSD
jgi:hypothetical protein